MSLVMAAPDRETLRRIEPMRTFADGRQLATHQATDGKWYAYERHDPTSPWAWQRVHGPFQNGRAASAWIRNRGER